MRNDARNEAAASNEDAANLPGGETTQIGSRTVARILIISDYAADLALPSVSDESVSGEAAEPADNAAAGTNGTYNGTARAGEIVMGTPPAEAARSEATTERSESGTTQPALQFVNALVEAGHVVSMLTRRDWDLGLALVTDLASAPELIIFDAGREPKDLDSLVDICREIKEGSTSYCASLLLALPPLRKNERARAGAIPRLLDAGMDDIFSTGAHEAEILARVSSLVQMARLRMELEATREHLRLHMQTDDVTRLLNRRFFFQGAHREYGRARRYNSELSCLMISVDFFKHYHSVYGYECGDYVLRSVAAILRDSTRDSDIVARFSEDKFVMILPETPIDGAIKLEENILRATVEANLTWRDHPLPVSLSMGEAARRRDPARAAGAPDEDDLDDEMTALSVREELAELLEEADAALYVARRGVRPPFSNTGGRLQSSRPVAAPRASTMQVPAEEDSLDDLPSLDN
jgi:diguanylate cyclase (GGDEF)-like protein